MGGCLLLPRRSTRLGFVGFGKSVIDWSDWPGSGNEQQAMERIIAGSRQFLSLIPSNAIKETSAEAAKGGRRLAVLKKETALASAVSLQLCFDYAITMSSTTSLVQESTRTTVSSPQRKYFIGQAPSTTMMSGGKS